jgi:hypothetical protein
MSLPGTHDTLTYDLGTIMSRTAITDNLSLGELIKLLEEYSVPGQLIGEFMKLQAQTQTLSLTDQLNSGVRFLDIRLSHEDDGWYGYHFVITNSKVDTYLTEINSWLEDHPTEMVVLWVSHHGSCCLQDQFPGAGDEDYSDLFEEISSIFGSKLVNPSTDGHPSETEYSDYQSAKRQVVLYLSDYQRFGSPPTALNACPVETDTQTHCPAGSGGICNITGASVLDAEQGYQWELTNYREGDEKYAQNKDRKTFFLMSGATSASDELVKNQALLHFLDGNTDLPPAYSWLHDCRSLFVSTPKSTRTQMSCPSSLLLLGQMTNFYHQRSMSFALSQMSGGADGGYRMPMAIYLDVHLREGVYDTGPKNSATYAYVGTMLESARLHTTCSPNPPKYSPSFNCGKVQSKIAELLKTAPYQDYSDPENGRADDWPPLPNALPECVGGYTEKDGNCYLEAYVRLQGSTCTGALSCQAPKDGMCSEGWEGQCHGNCLGSCQEDCVVDLSDAMQSAIQDGGDHTVTELSKYYVCDLSSSFVDFETARELGPDAFTFNNGGGAGTKDDYTCSLP